MLSYISIGLVLLEISNWGQIDLPPEKITFKNSSRIRVKGSARDDTHVFVGNNFSLLFRKHNIKSRDTSFKNNNCSYLNEILIKVKHHLNHDLLVIPIFYRVFLLPMNN